MVVDTVVADMGVVILLNMLKLLYQVALDGQEAVDMEVVDMGVVMEVADMEVDIAAVDGIVDPAMAGGKNLTVNKEIFILYSKYILKKMLFKSKFLFVLQSVNIS